MWDMAGTLLPYNSVTGTTSPLPGCDDFLPELGQDYRMVVTTGDQKAGAQSLLSGFGLMGHFEKIFGDLFAPVGKPYGEILRNLGGRPACSVAIGDRLSTDVASDTSEVLTILINQGDETANAGAVAMAIRILRGKADTFPEAFDLVCQESQPDESLLGSRCGGEITHAWRCDKGLYCWMARFTHPVLDGDRMIIVI